MTGALWGPVIFIAVKKRNSIGIAAVLSYNYSTRSLETEAAVRILLLRAA